MTSRPHRLKKTSSMQLKRRDLHHTWLHRETNEKLTFLLLFTTMNNHNLFHQTALSNTTEKKFTWNFMLLIANFPRILPRFDFFYEQNSVLATLKLTQSHVNSLLTTCIVPRISQTEGKVQTENNQSGSPLWNIIDFSSTMYFPSYEVAIYLWQKPIGHTTVSVCFSQ